MINKVSDKTAKSAFFLCSLYGYYWFLYSILYSFVCVIKMKLWGISYGRGCRFRGNTIFYKAPNTSITIGEHCTFNSNSHFNYRGINHCCILQTSGEGYISIGDRCGFSGVSIVSSCSVTMGNDVLCGANVQIGDRNDHEDIYPSFEPLPVTIGNHVWIGMNSVVMRGVSIGDNTIIGANSVVTKSIPANTIAVGNPCKVIKIIE